MTDSAPDMRELKAIIDWVNVTADVRELSLKFGDVELHVSRNSNPAASLHETAQAAAPAAAVVTPVPAAAPAPAAPAPLVAAPAPAAEPPKHADAIGAGENEIFINAPMVGTFYASPQPGAPTFVSAGDRVEPNSILGIVEVMKLMNNIEAGVNGTVVRVLVENESLVEFGQPLVVIKKDAS